MAKTRTKRQQAIVKRRIFLTCCAAVLLAVAALVAFSVNAVLKSGDKKKPDNSQSTDSSKVESVVIPETTARVISTGDIMAHSTQIDGARTQSGEYDFSPYFKHLSQYFKAADLAVANLEVTFGGTESDYRGSVP